MKKAIIFLSFILGLQWQSTQADDKDMIDKLGREAINTLTKPNSSTSDVESQFLTLLVRDFAIQDIAQFVMGRYWKSSTDDEKSRFVEIFKHRLKKAYASRFREYQGVKFTVNTNRRQSGYSIVNSSIQKPGDPAVNVDWWVKGGKIHDVVISGISMRSTLRDDYNALVASHNGNISNFLKDLESRA